MSGDPATPAWRLVYEGTDITRAIAGDVTRITYTDHVHGQSDEIEVTLADSDGRWRGAWRPAKGDHLTLDLGYAHALMPAGRFRIDEVAFSGGAREGASVVIRGLAAELTRDLRTRRSVAYEDDTLDGLAQRIAERHGFDVVGDIAPGRFERITQDDESDLAFIKRIAERYDHAVTVRGEQLVFVSLPGLREGGAAAVTLGPESLSRYRLRDQGQGTYAAAEVSYLDPATGETVSHRVEAGDRPSGDTLRRYIRVESPADAESRARALLARANAVQLSGSIATPGNPRIVAGGHVALDRLGSLSGRYLVTRSTHTIDRASGYGTEAEVERV